MKRAKKLRVMVPDDVLIPSWGKGFAVCTGDVPALARRCEWLVVAFVKTKVRAETVFDGICHYDGRALLDIDSERLVFVSPAGKVRRSRSAEADLLS